jgi:hypothetical protein
MEANMQMLRLGMVAGVVVMGMVANVRSSRALDPKYAGGMGGVGVMPMVVASNKGKAGDDGLARPGLVVTDFHGGVGLRTGGVSSSVNRGTDAAYGASGLTKSSGGGVGYSTMEKVPGRTPTYINLLAGKRMEPWVGNIGK